MGPDKSTLLARCSFLLAPQKCFAVFKAVWGFLAWCPLFLAGCNGPADYCRIEPSSIDFGKAMPPPFSETSVTLLDTLVVGNDGPTKLDGVVIFHVEIGRSPMPSFGLFPGVDSTFSVPAVGETSLVLAAIVTDENLGEYTGFVDLGASCGTVPFHLSVLQGQ